MGKDLPPLSPLGFTELGETPSCVHTGNNQIAWLKIATLGLRAGSPSPAPLLSPSFPARHAGLLHLHADSWCCQTAHA